MGGSTEGAGGGRRPRDFRAEFLAEEWKVRGDGEEKGRKKQCSDREGGKREESKEGDGGGGDGVGGLERGQWKSH